MATVTKVNQQPEQSASPLIKAKQIREKVSELLNIKSRLERKVVEHQTSMAELQNKINKLEETQKQACERLKKLANQLPSK